MVVVPELPGCVEGLVTASELRRVWENRTLPVVYSSPDREISVNCTGSSTTRILVGAYSSVGGDGVPQITIGNQTCNVSTEPVTEGVNVYECMLDSPVAADDSLTVHQRNATTVEPPLTDTPNSGHLPYNTLCLQMCMNVV